MNDYLVDKNDLDRVADAINKLAKSYEELSFPEGFIDKLNYIEEHTRSMAMITINTRGCTLSEYASFVLLGSTIYVTVKTESNYVFKDESEGYGITVENADYEFTVNNARTEGYLTLKNITGNVTVDIYCLRQFNIRYWTGAGVYLPPNPFCKITEGKSILARVDFSKSFEIPNGVDATYNVVNAEVEYVRKGYESGYDYPKYLFIKLKNPIDVVDVYVETDRPKVYLNGSYCSLEVGDTFKTTYTEYDYKSNTHKAKECIAITPFGTSMRVNITPNSGFDYPVEDRFKVKVPIILPPNIHTHKYIYFGDIMVTGCAYKYNVEYLVANGYYIKNGQVIGKVGKEEEMTEEPDIKSVSITLTNITKDVTVNITCNPKVTDEE